MSARAMCRARLAAAFLALLVFLPAECLAAVCGTVRVNAGNIAFGNYNAASPTADTANGTILVRCQGSALNWLPPFTVDLSTGGSGTYTPRRMAFGIAQLFYNLYTTAGYTTIWGNGTGGTANVASGGGTFAQVFTVYGRIPAGQYVTAGGYSDTITVTVTY